MVVMSVLSFSDNKYAGEQSRGKKAVEDILEDSALVQADYPQQRDGNHLSPAVCDRKEMLLEADYSRQVPNNDHSDDNRRLDGSSKELNCAPPRSYNELFRGVHVTENPLFTVDRKVNHTLYEGASFSKSGSSSLEGWNQSNVKEAVYIDERNFFTGMNSHSFSGSLDKKKANCVGGQGLQVLGSIFEPNNCVTPTNGKRTEINKGGEVDVPCTGDPMLISTSYTRAESRETPSLLHKLPGCISDQIMQSTDCKQQSGNQDGQSGLQGTEYVGGQGYVIGGLFESNNCVIPTDGETGGINKGKEVYIPCNAGSRPINTLNTQAESGDSASGVHKLPDLACKANDYKYLSSGCISDQVMQSTECKQQNRNRDGKSDLPGAECAEIDQPVALWAKNPQLGCACPHPKCHPEKCDHVYLFDNDYENADDIHGKPMHGRFPYAEGGRIVLPEGYLVYECNSSCHCDSTCENRVLQRGVQVKMEIFRTQNKGWAVRAGEVIPRGAFVCEYMGEVLTNVEANKRRERYGSLGCSYFYDIDAHIDGAKGFSKETVPYMIDATKYGNVSRFINHSCSPNLASYMVLVESMDSQFAHIGLYASQDIARGEEIAFDYRWNLLPGDGCPCHCGAPNCRGRLY